MHLLDETTLGIAILILLGVLVTVKRVATGSILDKPKGNLLVQLVNIFNLFFLLLVNPLTAVLLITHRFPSIDSTQPAVNGPSMMVVSEIVGLLLYAGGFALMAWALITLGRNYQLGGIAPRHDDAMVTNGPYRLIRHPMYAAALSISLGLALFVQSQVFYAVFCIYLVLILLLIPSEEKGLRAAYGEPFSVYEKSTRKLFPFIY